MTDRETASVQGKGPCRVCGGRGWHTAGGNDPAACGACDAGEAWYGGASAPPVPVPSDEAVEAYLKSPKSDGITNGIRDGLAAAYAIDLPRPLAEARAEAEAALLKHGDNLTTATIWSEGYQAGEAARTAETERLREALRRIEGLTGAPGGPAIHGEATFPEAE